LSFRVRERKKALEVEFNKTQKAVGRRILAAQPLSDGSLVIEADDCVFMLTDNVWHTLLPFGALSVRTFPRSKRFQNLIAITTEEGIHLIAAVDEEKYRDAIEGDL
jgi:hypothetical protein